VFLFFFCKISSGKSLEVIRTFPRSGKRSNPARMDSDISVISQITLEIVGLLLWTYIYVFEGIYRIFVPIPEKPIEGEIVLITGTGHGMGRQLAVQCAALKTTVICVDINEENNLETVKIIKENGSKNVHSYICDVSKEEEVQILGEKVKKDVGVVSILINNAGIMPCRQFLSSSADDIKKVFDVNVFAHFWTLRTFLPGMIERNHGHLVALSSMAGMMGVENLVPYSASKFAVRGLMEALSEETRTRSRATNIKFTTVFPYMVDTGLCHKPRIRFPSILSLVPPEEAARQIIQAMRRNILEHTIPGYLNYVNLIARLFPYKAAFALKDFLGSTLDEHDS